MTVACVEMAINAMGESNRSRSEADFCKYSAGLLVKVHVPYREVFLVGQRSRTVRRFLCSHLDRRNLQLAAKLASCGSATEASSTKPKGSSIAVLGLIRFVAINLQTTKGRVDFSTWKVCV